MIKYTTSSYALTLHSELSSRDVSVCCMRSQFYTLCAMGLYSLLNGLGLLSLSCLTSRAFLEVGGREGGGDLGSRTAPADSELSAVVHLSKVAGSEVAPLAAQPVAQLLQPPWPLPLLSVQRLQHCTAQSRSKGADTSLAQLPHESLAVPLNPHSDQLYYSLSWRLRHELLAYCQV